MYFDYPVNSTVGILNTLFNSAVGILTTLPFLRCGYFDHGYFEWYPNIIVIFECVKCQVLYLNKYVDIYSV